VTSDGFREVDVADAVALARDGHVVIDVREQVEWDAGHVAGATLLPLADVPRRIEELVPDRGTPILLHCAVGHRSAVAAGALVQMGYSDVVSLKGPIGRWREQGGTWEEPRDPLTPAQARRYARQTMLPEIGVDGQRRLLDARVLVVGAGGLGSPVALYLASAGVGVIGVVDDDVVDETNLHRQVLHPTERVGMPKVDSAEIALRALNPDVRVKRHAERLTAENAEGLLSGYAVVVDGTDNLEARYAINDAAVRLRVPVVHGSVYRWEGQVTTFVPFAGPCYRCMYATPPPAALAPACDVAGVPGVVPGLIGMLQATEVLKLVLGVGETLAGRLVIVDALSTRFDEVTIPRDPGCSACGVASAQATERPIAVGG
jgi:molybdopterin/thiamine biosynthesis adenylyltransferase/rhodanese-related sulfurtransferase